MKSKWQAKLQSPPCMESQPGNADDGRDQELTLLLEQQHRIGTCLHFEYLLMSRLEKDVLRTDRTVPEFAGGADREGAARMNSSLDALSNVLLTYYMHEPELGTVK